MIKSVTYLSKVIDPHSHMRDFEHSHKTTIFQYLLEAKRAGISISVAMPNPKPAIIANIPLREQIAKTEETESKLRLENEQLVFFGATDRNFHEARCALKITRVIGEKIYLLMADGLSVTTGTGIGVAFESSIFHHMELTRDAGKVIAVHCDHPAMIDPARNYYPKEAEVEAVKWIISIARLVPGVRVVICHPTCPESVEPILVAQREGMLIAFELEPHVLWFDGQGTNWNTDLHPNMYRVLNRLRTKDDMMYMRSLIKSQQNNDLIFAASDSACHTIAEKIQGASGIPSHQEFIPVILTLAEEMNIPNEQVIRLLSTNAAKFFGISIGSDLFPYRLEKRVVTATYNNGVVENPWAGSELYFPVPVKA